MQFIVRYCIFIQFSYVLFSFLFLFSLIECLILLLAFMDIYSITTRKELSVAYNMSFRTLKKRLEAIGITHNWKLTPKEIDYIFQELGYPRVKTTESSPRKSMLE